MSPREKPTIVIGAGLAGLACCIELERSGVDWQLYESSSRVGGRVATERVGDFLLDVGFHVVLTAYPAWRGMIELESLDLKFFDAGARIWTGDRFIEVNDPRRKPGRALETLFAPVGSLGDKLRTLRWGLASIFRSLRQIEQSQPSEGRSAIEALRQRGFSDRMIERFWRPFFGGVMLDPMLSQPAALMDFVFKMFSSGRVGLPAEGVAAIPAQLSARLPAERMHFNSPVARLDPGTVVLESGAQIEARTIVVATDAGAAARLLPERPAPPPSLAASYYYFDAPRDPVGQPILLLNGSGTGVINNLAVLNRVQPSCAPADRSLISVTCLQPTNEVTVRAELVQWFGSEVEEWKCLRCFDLPQALPRVGSAGRAAARRPVRPGVWVIGDHASLPTVHHTIECGKCCAHSVVADHCKGT